MLEIGREPDCGRPCHKVGYVLCVQIGGAVKAYSNHPPAEDDSEPSDSSFEHALDVALAESRVKHVRRTKTASGALLLHFSRADDAHVLGWELLRAVENHNTTLPLAEPPLEVGIGVARCRGNVGVADCPADAGILAHVLTRIAGNGQMCICKKTHANLPERQRLIYESEEKVEQFINGTNIFLHYRRAELPNGTRPRLLCVVCVDMSRYKVTVEEMSDIGVCSPEAVVQEEIRGLLRDACRAVNMNYDDCLVKWVGDGCFLKFTSVDVAVLMAKTFLRAAHEHNKTRKRDTTKRCFRVGIDYGRLEYSKSEAEWRGFSLANAQRLQDAGGQGSSMHCSGEIRISGRAFEKLSPEAREGFGCQELIPGKQHEDRMPGHRWAAAPKSWWAPWEQKPPRISKPRSSPLSLDETAAQQSSSRIPSGKNAPLFSSPPVKNCFVIMPLNPAHPRSAEVFERLIRPACKAVDYAAYDSNQVHGLDKDQVIVEQLEHAPMVVAYLGSAAGRSQFNSNVMLEVGIRLSSGRPIVFLRDQQTKTAPLPFYLSTLTVLEVPEDPKEKLNDLVEELKEGGATSMEWHSPRPFAEFRVSKRGVTVVAVSEKARLLFGDAIREGESAEKLVATLRGSMASVQYKKFSEDQFEIIKKLAEQIGPLTNSFGLTKGDVPIARIPMMFNDLPEQPEVRRGRAFLPVVVQYRGEGVHLYLQVLYLDVTKVVTLHSGGYCECDLGSGL